MGTFRTWNLSPGPPCSLGGPASTQPNLMCISSSKLVWLIILVNGNWITPCTCRHPDRISVLLSEEHVAYNTSIPCHYRKWMPLYSHCPVTGVSRQIRLCKEIPLSKDTESNPVHMNTLLVCYTGECNLHCSLEPKEEMRVWVQDYLHCGLWPSSIELTWASL